jgi:hypothetical protein
VIDERDICRRGICESAHYRSRDDIDQSARSNRIPRQCRTHFAMDFAFRERGEPRPQKFSNLLQVRFWARPLHVIKRLLNVIKYLHNWLRISLQVRQV